MDFKIFRVFVTQVTDDRNGDGFRCFICGKSHAACSGQIVFQFVGGVGNCLKVDGDRVASLLKTNREDGVNGPCVTFDGYDIIDRQIWRDPNGDSHIICICGLLQNRAVADVCADHVKEVPGDIRECHDLKGIAQRGNESTSKAQRQRSVQSYIVFDVSKIQF